MRDKNDHGKIGFLNFFSSLLDFMVFLCYTCHTIKIQGAYVMLVLRLPADVEQRLNDLAQRTGRTKSYYARKAIVEVLEDMEDVFLATQRLREKNPTVSLADFKKEMMLPHVDH
jgi:RHH-type rel operon transcriptional repressor/antitoxin RelB